MGFGVPLDEWFRGPLRERMAAALHDTVLEDLGLAPARARQVWADFLARKTHRTDILWSLFGLASWAGRWMRR
jgi:hypothetical protein